MAWRGSPVAPSRVASGSAASHWVYSPCKAISSATASRQRCARLRRSVGRRERIATAPDGERGSGLTLGAGERVRTPRTPRPTGKALGRSAYLCANDNYIADQVRLHGCVMLLIEKRTHQNNAPAKITRAENQTTRRGAREFAMPSGNAEVDQQTGRPRHRASA